MIRDDSSAQKVKKMLTVNKIFPGYSAVVGASDNYQKIM